MLGTTNFPKVALPYIQDLEAISFEIVQSISLPTFIRSYLHLTLGSLCAFSDWAEYASDKYTIICLRVQYRSYRPVPTTKLYYIFSDLVI